jgi:hypothetical protein
MSAEVKREDSDKEKAEKRARAKDERLKMLEQQTNKAFDRHDHERGVMLGGLDAWQLWIPNLTLQQGRENINVIVDGKWDLKEIAGHLHVELPATPGMNWEDAGPSGRDRRGSAGGRPTASTEAKAG